MVIDAAPAAGAREAESHFGKGASPAIVFSLHATKAFGIGEGGFVYSGDRTITEAVRTASNFGFDSDRVSANVGLNAKLSEYAAAVGLAALSDLEAKTREGRRLYDLYMEGFSASGLWDEGWEFHEYAGDGAPQFMSVLCPPRNRQVRGRVEVCPQWDRDTIIFLSTMPFEPPLPPPGLAICHEPKR